MTPPRVDVTLVFDTLDEMSARLERLEAAATGTSTERTLSRG